MPLNIAVQMDPMEKVNIAGDSSFAIMLAGQARDHSFWHYDVGELTYHADGRLTTRARPVTVQRVEGNHHSFGDFENIDLRADIDVVLMRQDPPFDLSYITATHLLERIHPDTLVVNDPASVRNAPEKLFVLDFADFMPPTMITRSLDDTRAFQREHGAIVVKPLYGNAGSAVFFVGEEDRNLAALTELFGDVWVEPFMVQAFLPDVSQGDKRIILVDGEPTGGVNRLPKKGEIRSNFAVGGSGAASELTPRELEICEALGPELKKRGLLFVGIDVIGGYLTEINVTSPTGIVSIDAFNGTDTGAKIWDAIESKL
ncbi:glutathione synthase [Parasphingopyxis lamellibrachiae]|uniref:Glutathione synthetase n=1 Tax=Parasphingopyxis lamellibrachiae TaxID=680125 RepID=A0A3D9FFT0_9SPHN|nr:glutathione synthase [Parasphingopyxis lamellibrachiae]RED15976.1 glutathione synthase [Parasphingopyxis lamellibrachiae]